MKESLITHAREFVAAAGPARRLLQNGGDVKKLRTNDLLRKQEWQLLDETLVGIQRQRLIGVNDLRNRGLVENLGGLGVVLAQYEKLGDMSPADTDFSVIADGERDSVTFSIVSVPIPIISKSFSLNLRRLLASSGAQSHGTPLDTTQVTVASAKVVEAMEDLLFNGTAKVLDGNPIYGYTTQTSINTVSGSTWGTVTNVTANIISAIDAQEADNYFGPYVLYAATASYGKLRAFFTDGSGDQVSDRVKRINGIEDVRPGDRLAAGTAVLVSMRADVVQWSVGQELTVVEWSEKGGLQLEFKVLTAAAPKVKADAAGGSGVTKITGIT